MQAERSSSQAWHPRRPKTDMKKTLLLLSLLLMGQSCEPTPPGTYCAGSTPPSTLDILLDNIGGAYSTIIGGTPSVDRRSTVWLDIINEGYCTGVAIGPHTVLSAAHCKGDSGYRVFLDAADRLRPDDVSPIMSVGHIVHPDYWKWLSNGDMAARQADLMLVFFEDEIPPPYIGANIYSSNYAKFCEGLTAQGWGKNEDATLDLRESDYLVLSEGERALQTGQAYPGGICFGDSGGPLYANVQGQPHLAGITSTTNSLDCLKGSTHIKVSNYWPWIEANLGWP